MLTFLAELVVIEQGVMVLN